MGSRYRTLRAQCQEALDHRERFWEKAAETLVWTKRWSKVMDNSQSTQTKWFVGGEMNLCYNFLDRHVEAGFGDKTAYIAQSWVTNTRKTYSYSEVLHQVSRFAGVLRSLGVVKGDVVMIYVPMIVEGAFAQLACARIGAIHACVPSGVKAMNLAERINYTKPKILIMGSHGYHGSDWTDYKKEVDAAYEHCHHKPEKIIVFQREHMEAVPLVAGRDLDWKDLMSKASPVDCVSIEANEPSLIIYTSGSTGEPKAILHAGARFAVRWVVDWPLYYKEDEVVFGCSNYGWVVGVICIAYGPLLHRSPSVIFEGDPFLTRDPRVLYKVLQDNAVTRALVRPGILKCLKGMDPEGKIASEFNLEKFRHIFQGGEKLDTVTSEWATKVFKAANWTVYGQTELACIFAGCLDNDLSEGEVVCQQRMIILPGWDIRIMNSDGKEAGPNEIGRVVVGLPLPPGSLCGIHNNEEAYQTYFLEYPGYFDTKDEGFIDEEGYLIVDSRADDQMKAGLGYITAVGVEEIVMKHDSVKECVVVSFPDLIWKEIPVIIFVRTPDSNKSRERIEEEVHKMLYSKMDPTIKFGHCVQVKELPSTRTGKIHRPSCRDMVRGREIRGSSAVENIHVFSDITSQLVAHGYGKNVLAE